jgi:hypothetical protein
MAGEQTVTTVTSTNSSGVHNPGLNELAQPGADGAPPSNSADPQRGSGVVDPATPVEEQELVASFLDNYDEPSAEELLAEAGVVEQVAPVQADPNVVTPQAPVAPQATPAVVQPVPTGQPGEVVQNQTIPGNVPPVVGQPQPQATPVQAPVQGQPAAQAVAPAANPIEALRASVEAQRETFITAAAQGYAQTFTDEDVQEFAENPRVALSKMGARLHFDIAQNTLGMISSQLPQMMAGLIQAHQVQASSEDEFFNSYPDLKPHKAAIAPIAQAYRHLNPSMPKEQFVQGLVALSRMQLGLQPQQQAAQPVQQQQQPVKPQAFRPAGSQVPVQQGSGNGQALENPWERIDFVMQADSQGHIDNGR